MGFWNEVAEGFVAVANTMAEEAAADARRRVRIEQLRAEADRLETGRVAHVVYAASSKPQAADSEVKALAQAMNGEFTDSARRMARGFFSHRSVSVEQLSKLLQKCGGFSSLQLAVVKDAVHLGAVVDLHMGFSLEGSDTMYGSDLKTAQRAIMRG